MSAAPIVVPAFHTQPLEVPELREFIRTRFTAGHHPQMLLRLGLADKDYTTVRRPIGEVMHEEPLRGSPDIKIAAPVSGAGRSTEGS